MTGLVNCTLECNLKCEYCFEGNGDIKKCPDLQLINTEFQKGISAIDRYIDELYEINHCDTTTIIWHGGEPTLVEPRLMAEVMELQKEKGHSIKWQIQTNGTLLGKYIDVLKKYNVSVGISIDGLKEHHDKYRVMKNDNPTFDIIMDNIEVLKANEIPFSVLLTITDNNVKSLLDIYYFLTSKNISFSFNALYPRNNNNDNAELNEDYFSDAICELFDCWIEDQNNKTIIAPFEQIIEGLLLPERGIPACNWQKDCMESFIAMDTSGDLYPCEHWVGFNKMKFGNIFQGLSNAIGKGSYFVMEDVRGMRL